MRLTLDDLGLAGRLTRGGSKALLSLGFFTGGFLWDWFTLTRIDQWGDNLYLLGWLLVTGGLVVLETRADQERTGWAFLDGHASCWSWLSQFFFGGLLSAYVVYYFTSTALGPSMLFLAFLAVMLTANEYLASWLRGEVVRLALYLFCAVSFFLFFIPVATGWMSSGVMFAAAVCGVGLTATVYAAILISPLDVLRAPWRAGLEEAERRGLLVRRKPTPWGRRTLAEALADDWMLTPVTRRQPLAPEVEPPPSSVVDWTDRVRGTLTFMAGPAVNGIVWAALLAVLFLLEASGAIPPVPFAIHEIGIYHQVRRDEAGHIELTYEHGPWWRIWQPVEERFIIRPEGEAYCFASVFSPRGTATPIVHHWMKWDEATGTWKTRDRMRYTSIGGRKGGYRWWSRKRALEDGTWRVAIETDWGREIGHIDVEMVDGEHPDPVWGTVTLE